ncbi:MAG: TrkA family potassium uptake protein [Clostridia bacterium]|nr:TrkA family potassium uptake protein [Clostridia bacterium]
MAKRKTEKQSYGIVGLGRFGMALARTLADSGADIVVVDQDEEKVRELREKTENAFVVQSLDKKTLEETGIHSCDVAVVCIGSKMDTSILTTLHLVSLGVPKVIAKANSAEHGEILEKLGAEVVYPERDMAVRLANRLETARVMDFMQLSERVNISKLRLPAALAGRTVLAVNMRSRFGINIIAIEHGGAIVDSIKPDYVFREGDILFVACSREGLLAFTEWAEKE